MRISDWSSDVCSSDLERLRSPERQTLTLILLGNRRSLEALSPARPHVEVLRDRPSHSELRCGGSADTVIAFVANRTVDGQLVYECDVLPRLHERHVDLAVLVVALVLPPLPYRPTPPLILISSFRVT